MWGWTRVGSRPATSASRRRIRKAPARVSGAALRVQEQLRPVPPVEVGPAAGQIPAHRVGGVAADRHDALLAALAGHPHEPVVEVDAALFEPDRLRDAQPGAVQQLDERLVAQVARLRSLRGVDQALRLAGRERLRERLRPARQLHGRGGVVVARAEQLLVAEEAARRRCSSRDRRRREPVRAHRRRVALELLEARLGDRLAEVLGERREIAAVRLDGARRSASRRGAPGSLRRQDRGWAWS